MEYKDYYQIMGVGREASPDDIKRAYRKLARKYHPDVSKEKDAEARFKDVNEAYEVLKDPEKRKAYDQFGNQWQAGQQFNPNDFDFSQFQQFNGGQGFQQGTYQGGTGDFSDFFESLFGGRQGFSQQRRRSPRPQEGEDLHTDISISLEEAYHGLNKTLQLRVPAQDASGHWHEEDKILNVKIPAGVKDGQQIRLAGQGAQGMYGGANGDLYLKIHLKEHPLYRVVERDIHLNVPIAPWEAALGAEIRVPTLGGMVDVKIPANAKTGQKMRLRGRGLSGKEVGDQYLILQIQTPAAGTEAERELYQNMAKQFANFFPRKDMEG